MSASALIAVAAVGVVAAPLYLIVTRASRRIPKSARWLLVCLSALDLFIVVLAAGAPRLRSEDVGRFDDLMYGVTGLGIWSLVATAGVVLVGHLVALVRERRRIAS
jgi:hypothetical protein